MKPWSPFAAKPPVLFTVPPVDVPDVELSNPLTSSVGFPTNFTWSLPTSRFCLLPYAKPGGVPLQEPVPAPPKSEFVVMLPQTVEDGSPAISNVAEDTSAP